MTGWRRERLVDEAVGMSGGDGFDVSPVELRPDRSILEWVIENTRIEPSAKQMNCSKRREQKEFNI